MSTRRTLDRCDRALPMVLNLVAWFAVICTVSMIAVQGLMYLDRKGYTALEQRFTYRVVSTGPAHGGDAWQTK